ncbi:phage tail tape measure protein, partial [Vreelandella maris]|uniref:phage tail tape measure protein n=1 Tax=Vreelandella maris TaxID=2729617 RepID=UPI0030EB3999
MESRLELVVSSQAAQQHINRLQRELERLDGRGSAATAMMGKMSLAIGAISAAAGGLGFSRIIRETADFEDAMLGLQAVSGATTKQMADLEKQARTLGATSMFSAEQAGNAQRYLAQAGFEVNEVLSATPGILRLATAGQLDLASAADIASNVLGQFVLPVTELARVSDVLAASAAGSNTNISQMAEALSQAGPIANSAGVSIEETAAAIGVLSDAGIQGGRAGTGLLGVIRQLSNVTPKSEEVLAKYGLTVEDVDVQTNGLNNVLAKLGPLASSVSDSFAVFQSEAGPAAQILANGADRARDFSEELGPVDVLRDSIGRIGAN